MPGTPDRLVQEAFVAPTSEITRRVEIYEFDGKTPWKPETWGTALVSGSVSIDMSRDERRSVDVELNNEDGAFDPKAGGLWYDKVLKVFYGIQLNQTDREPKLAIVEEFESIGQGLALKTLLAQAGIQSVFYDPQIEDYDQIEDFDIIISISSDRTRKLSLLTEAFNRGKSVMTFGLNATAAQLPYVIGAAASSLSTDSDLRTFEKTDLVDLAMNGWQSDWQLEGPHSYRKINTAAAGAMVLANTWDATNGFSVGIILRAEMAGPLWLHTMQNDFTLGAFDQGSDLFASFLGALVERIDYYVPQPLWEMQIGEFVPDSIEDADEYGERIKFTGRDYAKRCLNSKLTKATMFTKSQKIEDVIKSLALNCKISKINLPVTNFTLGKDMTWERDTDRWAIMKAIALANNYEIYFDNAGWLIMRPQQDPLLTPPSLVLTTGIGGNLVARGAKTGDSQLFNHVTVIGESSDSSVPLVFGEAINNNPNSPSSIDAIGERTKNISSPLVTSEGQATELARTMLSVSALEEFELNFEAVLFPWIEAGEIVEMGEPEGTYWGPTRYLISNLTLPLDLSPMSGNGKRVTRVS